MKQIATVAWGADPALQAEVLDSAGKGTGKIVYIKNADVIDMGAGGVANKPLPIPAAAAAPLPAPSKTGP